MAPKKKRFSSNVTVNLVHYLGGNTRNKVTVTS